VSQQLDIKLKESVRFLGTTLGDTIRAQLGEEWLQRIETIRLAGRDSYQGTSQASQQLKDMFSELKNEELLTIGRAFSQFLNLANIAEQEFNTITTDDDPVTTLFDHLEKADISQATFAEAFAQLKIDLVLTAHPTEVTRRTLIHKHSELGSCLRDLHQSQLNDTRRKELETRIADLIAQAWHTEEIRTIRPTPVDEAKWGFSVIENSLWDAVPQFIRSLEEKVRKRFNINLPIDAAPVQFSSWMGGDRDGNPNVTSKVTQQVLLLSRKRAAKLFARDLDKLQVELSMSDCDEALRKIVGDDALEPYRALLRPLLAKLIATQEGIDEFLAGKQVSQSEWIRSQQQLLTPLLDCYRSLHACGMQVIADGGLLDTIRRVH